MNKRDRILSVTTLGAFLLGAVLGLFLPDFFTALSFVGTVYVNLLKLMALPILLCTVFSAAARSVGKASGLLWRTVLLFALLFAAVFCLTAAVASLSQVGVGAVLGEETWEGEVAAISLSGFFTTIFSSNIFASLSANAMLPCILFAFACGLAAGKTKAEKTMAAARELEGIFSLVLRAVLYLTPLGVFSLMGSTTAQYGLASLGASALYVLTAWGCCLLALALVLMLPLWIFVKVNPWTYLKRMGRVLLTSLSTCSSAATLPETLRTCKEEFKVPEEITGVVVPLGCTIHMCGGAVSFCLLGFFTLHMAGQPVTVGMFLYMLLLAELMNMAAPGIPGGGVLLGATFLSILGAPLSIMGMYAGIYRLLDMAYTSLNVAGDVTANALLYRLWQKRKGLL